MDARFLTSTENDFLRSQGLSAADVYDARNKSSASWKAGAKAAGLAFVLGTPCEKAGHRLRTRAGHCVQCDTKKIAYQQRHEAEGYVYIAGSRKAKLLKVGTAVDVKQREHNLQGQSYGGVDDWVMLFSAKVPAGGRIEGEALRRLAQYQTTRSYTKDGRQQEAGELVACSLSKVMTAMWAVLEGEEARNLWHHSRWREYDFD